MPGARVIVVGSVNTDLVIRAARLPRPGETVLGGEFYESAGGKGANQAVAAARVARQPVLFVAAVGDDAYGRRALENLSQENLDARWVKTVRGAASGVALIIVGHDGENAIAVASGANDALTPGDIDRIGDDAMASAGVWLTSLEIPLETALGGLRRAREAGLITILNPAPAERLRERLDVLRYVDILTPNESEAALLTGVDCSNGERVLEAANRLRQAGCRQCIVTLGAAGCLVVGDAVTEIAGRPVDAVDATAAGDAFNGVLAVGLAEGRTVVEAARWANRAAALAVTRRGAQPSLPRRNEFSEDDAV
ncbi:MAG TPA: ribokinase [Pirellulales bacterium]